VTVNDMSVRPHGTNSAPTGRIFMKFDILIFLSEFCRENFRFYEDRTRITGTLREYPCTFLIISRSLHPGMKKCFRQKL